MNGQGSPALSKVRFTPCHPLPQKMPSRCPQWCVFLSDFGTKDGAVSELMGVMYTIYPEIRLAHLSHEITPFNITEAAWRLYQGFHYWPESTYFVCVVDPDVGMETDSLWCQANTGHFFLAPDNGLLSVVEQNVGLKSVRKIDRARHLNPRHAGHTSYGRDLYAYVAARILAGWIKPSDLGPEITTPLAQLPMPQPLWSDQGLAGSIVLFDGYGNAWSDIDLHGPAGDIFRPGKAFRVTLRHEGVIKLDQLVPFATTYGCVAKNEWVLYGNSMDHLALAVYFGNACEKLQLSLNQLEIHLQWADGRNTL